MHQSGGSPREAEAKAAPADRAAAAAVEKLATARAVLGERIAGRTAKGKDATGPSIHPDEPEAMVQPQKDKKTFAPSYKLLVLANAARVAVAGTCMPRARRLRWSASSIRGESMGG